MSRSNRIGSGSRAHSEAAMTLTVFDPIAGKMVTITVPDRVR